MSKKNNQNRTADESATTIGKELVLVDGGLFASGKLVLRSSLSAPADLLNLAEAIRKLKVPRESAIVVSEPLALGALVSPASETSSELWISPTFGDLTPVPTSGAQLHLDVSHPRAEVVRVFATVTDLARWALGPTGWFCGDTDEDHRLRKALLAAAAKARAAFLDGGGREAVADFAFVTLGLNSGKYRETTLEAVVQVLLEQEWCDLDIRLEQRSSKDLRTRLKRDVRAAHRAWRPIGDTKLNGVRIGSLNMAILDGAGSDLIEQVAGTGDVEGTVLSLWGDPAAHGPASKALARLTPVEQEVVWLAASGMRWNEAAEIVGLSANAGKNLRARFKRSTVKFMNRDAQRNETAVAV